MQGRQNTSNAPASPDLNPLVNKFGNFQPNITLSGPFAGAGRRRAQNLSDNAASRREAAVAIAAAQIQGGMTEAEVYVSPPEIGDTMLALDGSGLSDHLGRPRRAWHGDPEHAHQLKARVGREFGLFCQVHHIDAVFQIVARPPDSEISLDQFAARHASDSAKLGDMLRYAKKSRVPEFQCDLISAEIKNVGLGGWLIDEHFHLIGRGLDVAGCALMQEYFEARGWTLWVSDFDDGAAHHPVALAQYEAKGVADDLINGEAWTPDAIVELRRQTRGLALVRATGAFRRWKSELSTRGMTVATGADGKHHSIPKRVLGERLRRMSRATASLMVLRLCVHDFGDGLIREAVRVRGRGAPTLSEVRAIYELADVYQANTAIPESYRATPTTFVESANVRADSGVPPPSDVMSVPW